MRLRGAAVQGGLAAVALVAAYVTWQRTPDNTSETVIVLDVSKRELEKIRYEDPTKWVELSRRDDDGETAVWLRSGTKELPDAGASLDGGAADAGVSVGAAKPPPDRELKGSELAEKLFERFAPLRASRALGVVEQGKLSELGLDKPLRSLVVRAAGRDERYAVGTSSLGMSSPYLRDERDGKVWLLGGGVLSDLDMGPSRLIDRRLHTFSLTDYDAMKVTANGRARDLVVVPGQVPAQNKLAPKSSPTAPDDFAKNWHDKVWRSFPSELLGKGELPPGGAPEPHFRIDYLRGNKPVGFLEVAPVKADLYARTEHTASWVKLSAGGEGLTTEADRLVAEDRK